MQGLNKLVLACLLVCVVKGAAYGQGKNHLDLAIRPGHIIILTESGHVPDIRSLMPGLPFSDFKACGGWEVRGLGEVTGMKRPSSKSSSLLDDLYILSFPDTLDVLEVLSRIKGRPGIRLAEPDYLLELYSWPDDALFSRQWYLHNTGQGFYAIDRIPGDSNDVLYIAQGRPGADINMAPIYDNPPADTVTIVVGIIDTGIDYDHPDLADNLYVNRGEIPDNGIDDDHNGLVDDYRGWDFSGDSIDVFNRAGDNDATDAMGHGTHVAGLVAAVQNSIGISGYPGKIEILPVKIFPNSYLSVSIAGLIYAADMGAKVLNLSWGFPYDTRILQETLRYTIGRGCLPVAAAGNFGTSDPTYPAFYPETFTVGGTSADGYMAYFSTYGPFVDIVAPAHNILSLRAAGTDMYAPKEPNVRIIEEDYYLADGTSMAAPLVTGAAAMLLSFNPALEPETIREILRQSAEDMLDPWGEGDNLPGYDTVSGWGWLNVGRAFALAQAPAAYLTSPRENDIATGEIVVSVATTGGYSGPADLYYREGKNAAGWAFLHHADSVREGDTFFIWNSAGLNGHMSMRLESSNGANEINFRLINENRAEIMSPIDDGEVKYLVEIYGKAYGIGYDSTVISYRSEAASFYKRLAATSAMFFGELIYEWPIFSLNRGYHYLKMEVFIGDGVLTDSVRVMALSAMRDGFPVYMTGYSGFSPGVADIDGDGYKEIVAGSRSGLYAFKHDGALMDGFPVMPGTDFRSMPAFDDVDGDGLADIIIVGQNILACYNYLGQALPGWPRAASTGMTFSSFPIPTLTQLYDAADSVILYMNKYGEIHAYKYNGDPYFYSLGGLFSTLDPNINDTSLFVGLNWPFVSATDLDGNGTNEVIAFYSGSVLPSGVYIWNGRNGLPPFDWKTPLAMKVRQAFGGMLADVDNDGRLEIIMAGMDTSYTMTIWVTKNGRENLPGWPIQLPELEGWIGTAPVCVDIDGDGSKEIVAAYFGYDVGRVYVFNSDGTPYIDNPAVPPGMLLHTPTTLSNVVIADIDGNGIPNIISRGGYVFPGTGYERIYAWEPNGDPTPGFPIVTPTPVNEVISTFFTPLIDDLDGDGKAELIMCGDDRNIFVWDLDAPYDSTLKVWRKFLGDSKNTGINPDRADPTDVHDHIVVRPDRFEITGNHPNPFNPATAIEFGLDRSTEIRLEVFNILGQRVKILISGWQPAGVHRIVWDGTDGEGFEAASGVYFVRLSDGKRQAARKMMLLR